MSTTIDSSLGVANEDRGPALRIYVITLFIVALIATLLRFWSRALYIPQGRQFHRFWWDDWIALAATFAFTLEVVVILLLIKSGLGRHIEALSMPQLATTYKYLFAFRFVYVVTVPLSKASALLFLTRIFPDYKITAWFNVIVWIMHILNILWFIGIIVATFLSCNPIKKGWEPWVTGTCRSTHELYLGSAVPSVFIDLIILLLPMPRVWNLRTGIARRCAITALFVLGYIVVIASLGRLVATYTEAVGLETDITYGGLAIFYWTYAESAVLIVSISLPAMPNLLSYLRKDLSHSVKTKLAFVFNCGPSRSSSSTSREDKVYCAAANESFA
ncbi:hypothetical protein F4680DRAFT_410029 [Xylaria scruposa]|nr:hypothetical protein F4680DRAFT_410029 [Xylaria scruposa]